MNTTFVPVARPPRVWVVYRDTRKDMSKAERFGRLTEMFSGRVSYDRAIEQARKMMEDYRDGDSVMMVGDPTLCLIVGSVAQEYSESGVIRILRWDRDEVAYEQVLLDFEDTQEAQPDGDPPAEIFTQNRYR